MTPGTKPEAAGASSPQDSSASTETRAVAVRRTRQLSLSRKLLFTAITFALFFGLLETLLWLFGVRQFRDIRDPFVGFTAGAPLFTQNGELYETTAVRRTYFNYQTFAAVPKPGVKRMFCLGGSTTYGHPYDDTTSYPRWLRDLLNHGSAETRWEVVNCGGISYASYRLAYLADELLRYKPDVLVVHTGHNEFLEDRSYGAFRDMNPAVRNLAAIAGYLRTTTVLDRLLTEAQVTERSSQPMLPEEVDPVLDRSAGPASYVRDDARAAMVNQHFEYSLRHICRLGRDAGIQVILVRTGSNLRDFAPFKSQSSSEGFFGALEVGDLIRRGKQQLTDGHPADALKSFRDAVAADPRNADAAFLAGTAAAELGQCDVAKTFFEQARDEDVCPLRAPRAILETVTKVAQEEGVPLVDFEAILEANALKVRGCGVPGAESFLDHVHPTVEMHRELAVAIAKTLQSAGQVPGDVDFRAEAQAVEPQISSTMNPGRQATGLTTVAQVLSWAGKNAEALRLSEEAEKLAPNDVEVLSQLGRLYEKAGRLEDARTALERAVQAGPDNPWALYRLARLHMREEDWSGALNLLERSRQHTTTAQPSAFRTVLFRSLSHCCQQLGDMEKTQIYSATADSQ